MRFLTRSLIGVVLFSITLALLSWAGASLYGAVQARLDDTQEERPQRERVFAVNVVTLEHQSLTPEMVVFGQIESRRTLDIRAAAEGTLITLAEDFENGARVSAGTLLAQINPADAQSALDRGRTDLREAEAELRDAERGLLLAQDDLAAAQDQADLRVRALERQQNLRTRGVGADAAVEEAELAAASARQTVLSRRQALNQEQARIDQANTRLERERINVAEAERRVEDTEIFAEFDGALSDVTVVEGGRVSVGEQLAQLIDPDQLEVSFRLSTSQYARLLDDGGDLITAPVAVTLDVLGLDLTATGQITRESAAVGEGQSGRLLFASLEDTPGFRPGDFVTVRIAEPELQDVARLPSTAIAADGSVLVLGEDDRLERAQVALLRRQEDDVIVRADGLTGREVVAERSPLLGEGIRVRPLRAPGTEVEEDQAMIELTPERRARLVAFVEANTRMPADAKDRLLVQLEQDMVPAQMIEQIEGRMGG